MTNKASISQADLKELESENSRLLAENKRMREALGKIGAGHHYKCNSVLGQHCDCACGVATEALKPAPSEEAG